MEWLAFDLVRSFGASCGEARRKVGQESERALRQLCVVHLAADTPTCILICNPYTSTHSGYTERSDMRGTQKKEGILQLLTLTASALGCRKQRPGRAGVEEREKEQTREKESDEGCVRAELHTQKQLSYTKSRKMRQCRH